jgi:hypothetical protein
MDKVGLCNMAIGNLGMSQFIGNIDEASNEARVCRIFYDQALNRTLEEFPWSFARSYADLQDIGTPPSNWLYRYRYPTDCLFIRDVTERDLVPVTTDYFDLSIFQYINMTDFEIVEDQDGGGLSICTNIAEAMLTYTKRITSFSLFSALFIDAFAWSLSKDIASPLSAQPSMAEKANQAYTASLLKAAARSLNENKTTNQTESEYITARY